MNKKIKQLYKNRNNRIIISLLLLIYIIPCSLLAKNEYNPTQETDSLQHILAVQKEPEIIIPVLNRLSVLTMQQSEELSILHRWLKESVKIDSIESTYAALNNLTRYYYNKEQSDSLLYWTNIVDSLATTRNEYPNVLFDAKCRNSQNILYSGNYEQAMTEAIKLYQLASKTKQTYGQVRCSETLGIIYRVVHRYSDAITAFQEGLDLIETIGGNLETKIRLTSYQTISGVRTDMFEKTNKILANYKTLIDQQAEANMKAAENYPVKREYWILYTSYAAMHLRQNDLVNTKISLDSASVYAGNTIVEGDYIEKYYFYTLACYHFQIGSLLLALNTANELLKVESLPEYIQLKIDILKKQGKLKEALLLYDKIEEISQQKNNATFLRQINQLRTLHEVNDKERLAQELEINNLCMKHRQELLIISFLLIVFLLTLLYIVYKYYQRAQRLKNELLKDKESLLQLQQSLKCEKDKAEEASRVKSAFVANMSHEIRTPLNAIVGFSGLQADPSATPEEIEEYTSIIRNNTDLLLNLVNDVLDISSMGSGDMNFTFHSYTLNECCLMALESIRCRIPENVKLTYTPVSETINIYTDKLRLQQLLTNLLTNAAKFTKEGEINLSFQLIEGQKLVRIAITDTGIGIPLEKQASIFNRFEKLDDFKPGAGLGLSICSIIAERLGGSISIDSSYTNGARFVFIHPVNDN